MKYLKLLATTAGLIIGISAAGTAGATIYSYQGNAFTTQRGVEGVNRVTATIDFDGTDVEDVPFSWSITGLDNRTLYSDFFLQADTFNVTSDKRLCQNADVTVDDRASA